MMESIRETIEQELDAFGTKWANNCQLDRETLVTVLSAKLVRLFRDQQGKLPAASKAKKES